MNNNNRWLNIFKLVSLNVNGLNNFNKRRTMFTWCRKCKADISFLQETHSTIKTDTQWKNKWKIKPFTWTGNIKTLRLSLPAHYAMRFVPQFVLTIPINWLPILKRNYLDRMLSKVSRLQKSILASPSSFSLSSLSNSSGSILPAFSLSLWQELSWSGISAFSGETTTTSGFHGRIFTFFAKSTAIW